MLCYINFHPMKKEKRLQKLEMIRQVNALMETHLDKWNSIEEIRKTYDGFVRHMKKYLDLQPDPQVDPDPEQMDTAVAHINAMLSLLEKRLDRLMRVFSGTHPGFYKQYKKARK